MANRQQPGRTPQCLAEDPTVELLANGRHDPERRLLLLCRGFHVSNGSGPAGLGLGLVRAGPDSVGDARASGHLVLHESPRHICPGSPPRPHLPEPETGRICAGLGIWQGGAKCRTGATALPVASAASGLSSRSSSDSAMSIAAPSRFIPCRESGFASRMGRSQGEVSPSA